MIKVKIKSRKGGNLARLLCPLNLDPARNLILSKPLILLKSRPAA